MIKTDPHLIVESMFQPALPPRAIDSHKGSFGSVAVIGGDDSMVGAVLLAARAALLSGAGRIYAAILSKYAPVVDILYPEIMLRSPSALAQLSQLNCVAIGPGLGQSKYALELLENWLLKPLPLLLDADALNLIATHSHLISQVKNRQAETVLTPHAGEAARLLTCSAEYIQQNRIDCALQLSQKFNATCVLKGAGTICAHHDGSYFVNTTGNSALAVGGTGDVLSGVIASLIAQGLSALNAATLGVYVHGAAADSLVAKDIGPIGVTASEIALEVRNVLNWLNQSN